jgi:hypothetical protein
VMMKVKAMVSSMEPQFEATGVALHGLMKWNTSEPATTSRIMTDANMLTPDFPRMSLRTGDHKE